MNSTTTQNGSREKTCSMVSSLTRMAWIATLMLSLTTEASAFHSSAREFACVKHANTFRAKSNTASYEQRFDGIRSSLFSPNARTTSALHVQTRLQYRDGDDDAAPVVSNAPSASRWWQGILPAHQSSADDEQENVDAYLEFLDRRYKRLHSTEDEQEAPKPFSAINWLLQGQPNRGEVHAEKHQQEDALYVLGVAGLASQKLLQKHQLVDEQRVPTTPSHADVKSSAIVDVESENDSASAVFIQKVVVPVVRVVVIAQRRRAMFVNNLSRSAATFSLFAARSVAKTVVYGPYKASKAILELGGGKKTLAMTITLAYTSFLFLRPVLKAIFAEASVRP